MGLIQALLHFQNNPMLHLRILFLSNFAWQNSCRIVALFFHKWISRHSDKKCVDIVPSDPALNKSAYFWENKKAVNTCNYVSTAFFAAFSYLFERLQISDFTTVSIASTNWRCVLWKSTKKPDISQFCGISGSFFQKS